MLLTLFEVMCCGITRSRRTANARQALRSLAATATTLLRLLDSDAQRDATHQLGTFVKLKSSVQSPIWLSLCMAA
jgi:hypothetical protein